MNDRSKHLPGLRDTALKITKRRLSKAAWMRLGNEQEQGKFALGYAAAIVAKRREDTEDDYYENARYMHGAPHWSTYFLGLARSDRANRLRR